MSIASRPHRPGCGELVSASHDVVVQRNAGEGSSISDDDYTAAGAKVLDTADAVWESADLVLKVKEPIAEEYHRMRGDQMLFTHLHLAASQDAPGPSWRPGRHPSRTRRSSCQMARSRCCSR